MDEQTAPPSLAANQAKPNGEGSPWKSAALPTDEQKKRFRQLAGQWRQEVAHLSSSVQMAAHPACREIISMGAPAIPLLLAELQRAPHFWFAALRALTGENPVPKESAGDVKAMARAWIQWGRDKGHIK
jgi:hypothetical protein